MAMVTIAVEPGGLTFEVEPGTTIYRALLDNEVMLDAACGGHGRCGRCRVRASGELGAPTDAERRLLGSERLAAGWRLGCQTPVLGPCSVEVPEPRVTAIVARAADVRPAGGPVVVAVDLGTTTIAAAVLDAATGDELVRDGALNPQHIYGADVMSRSSAAAGGDAPRLRFAAVRGVEALVLRLLGAIRARPSDVERVVIVGNAVMTHLLLGRDTAPLTTAPYRLLEREAHTWTGRELGFTRVDAAVDIPAAAGPFLGSDALAGVLSRSVGTDGPELLIDLGTNGEIVLVDGERVVAASAAAGPAFEAVDISWGMRAAPGAVEGVVIEADGSLELRVIGGGPPLGLCGSGLLDAVRAAREVGVLAADGRLVEPAESHGLVAEDDAGRRLVLDAITGVSVTQHDIRSLQLAKGAVAVAVDAVLAHAGVEAADVRRVVLAGGFGARLDPASAIVVGLLPAAWADRIEAVGATALDGAAQLAAHPELSNAMADLAQRAEVLDLASQPTFTARFVDALAFPELG
jgi:uncharacterized 2Fe-2S/4Fe-4S cluster protein (DUF4445 family)